MASATAAKTTTATATTANAEDYLGPIPESSKTTSLSGQFWVWAGANIAPMNWILGALGLQMGLGLWETFGILAIGNLLGMSIFGLMVVVGQRTGATAMILGRQVFGRRANYIPAIIQSIVVIGWCAINTWIVLDLVVALFNQVGWSVTGDQLLAIQLTVALVVMAIQVTVSLYGYKAIAAFEKWTVPVTVVIMLAMTVAAWFFLGVDWGYSGSADLQGVDRVAAASTVMTAIGIGWGFTWLTYAADYSRFVSRAVPAVKLFGASALGQLVPVLWLGLLGATLATKNPNVDPGQLIAENFGVLSIPILLLVVHAPIATNILNIYSFTVSMQSLDLKINRRVINVGVGGLAMCGVLFFLVQSDIGSTLSSWLSGVAGWTAVWGGIMLVHFYVFEPKRTEFGNLFNAPGSDGLPAVRWKAVFSFLLGLCATWLFSFGTVPALQGFASQAIGGIDLSWLAGIVTSSLSYYLFARKDWISNDLR